VLPTRREGESAHGLVLRGRLFGRAIEQARDEGLLELADALLGFYLVTQTLTDSDHDSIDWSIAGPALNEAAGRFEEGILAGCIQLAYQLSVEAPGDKSFDQGRLDYFRRSSAPAVTSFDVTKLLRMVHAERRMTADQALDKRISPKIKAALPDFVRQLLLEAENDYEHRLSRRRAESSEIDFASVVQNYFKPVELILLRTYENVSTYPGFHEFAGLNSNQSRPPIVKVINVFRRHDSLPEPVRRHLSSEGCLLGSSSEYSLEWLHEFRLLRNRAAHGGFVAQHEVESIRDNLYTHGLRCLLYGVPSKVLRTLPG